jgi:adenylate kinase
MKSSCLASPKKLLCLIGCPGSGKTTASKWIARAYNFKMLDMGTLVRERLSDLSTKQQKDLASGELLGDDVCLGILKPLFSSLEGYQGAALSGFPRTVKQYELLKEALSLPESDIAASYLILELAPAAALHRIEQRRKKAEHNLSARTDDSKATSQRRLEVFAEETTPLIDLIAQEEPKNYCLHNSYQLKRSSLLSALIPLLGSSPAIDS